MARHSRSIYHLPSDQNHTTSRSCGASDCQLALIRTTATVTTGAGSCASFASSNITAITTSTTINRSPLAPASPARSLLPPAPPCCLPCERRRCWPKPWGSCLQPWTGTAQPSAARHQAAPPVSPAPESWQSQRWLQLQVQQSPHLQVLLMAPQMGQAHAVTPKGRGVKCSTQRTRHFVTSTAQVRRPHSAHTLRARHSKP